MGAAVTITAIGYVGRGTKGDFLAGQIAAFEGPGLVRLVGRGHTLTFRGVPGNLPVQGHEVCVDGRGYIIPLTEGQKLSYRNYVVGSDPVTYEVTVTFE